MFELSQRAAAALIAILERAGAEPKEGLRVKKEDDHFILQLDSPRENDRVIYIGNRVGLIIELRLEDEVRDLIIDLEEGSNGARLTIGDL
jgi:hypothetical protein